MDSWNSTGRINLIRGASLNRKVARGVGWRRAHAGLARRLGRATARAARKVIHAVGGLGMTPELPTAHPKWTRSRVWHRFWSNPLSWIGVGMFLAMGAFCFGGPVVYPASASAFHLTDVLAPPSPAFPLGTDSLGRNQLARLMVGGQLSIAVALAASLVATGLGVGYGLVSGYWGGWVDAVLMRLIDVLYAIPGIFVLMAINSWVHPNGLELAVEVGLVSWFGVARLVRGEVMALKQREFVEAARACGASSGYIMRRHLLPHLSGLIAVSVTLEISNAVLTVSGLSFLGLGLPPNVPNWGTMLSESMAHLFENSWWLVYPPGLALFWVVLSVHFIGDALRQAFDIRLGGPKRRWRWQAI